MASGKLSKTLREPSKFIFLVFLCGSLFKCSEKGASSSFTSLNIRVYKENEDIYVLNWNDSTALSKLEGDGDVYEASALEYNCHFLSQLGDTLGSYTGSSQPRSWTYVYVPSGTELKVIAYFSIGINPLSSFYSDLESIELMSQKYGVMEFEPVEINIGAKRKEEIRVDLILK